MALLSHAALDRHITEHADCPTVQHMMSHYNPTVILILNFEQEEQVCKVWAATKDQQRSSHRVMHPYSNCLTTAQRD